MLTNKKYALVRNNYILNAGIQDSRNVDLIIPFEQMRIERATNEPETGIKLLTTLPKVVELIANTPSSAVFKTLEKVGDTSLSGAGDTLLTEDEIDTRLLTKQEEVGLYNDGTSVGKSTGHFTSKDSSGTRQLATLPDHLIDKGLYDEGQAVQDADRNELRNALEFVIPGTFTSPVEVAPFKAGVGKGFEITFTPDDPLISPKITRMDYHMVFVALGVTTKGYWPPHYKTTVGKPTHQELFWGNKYAFIDAQGVTQWVYSSAWYLANGDIIIHWEPVTSAVDLPITNFHLDELRSGGLNVVDMTNYAVKTLSNISNVGVGPANQISSKMSTMGDINSNNFISGNSDIQVKYKLDGFNTFRGVGKDKTASPTLHNFFYFHWNGINTVLETTQTVNGVLKQVEVDLRPPVRTDITATYPSRTFTDDDIGKKIYATLSWDTLTNKKVVGFITEIPGGYGSIIKWMTFPGWYDLSVYLSSGTFRVADKYEDTGTAYPYIVKKTGNFQITIVKLEIEE